MTDEQTVEQVASFYDTLTAPQQTIHDALCDSQYLAGATAGWNAAQADNANDEMRKIQNSREGRLAGLQKARAAIAAMQPALAEAEARGRNAGLREAATELEVNWGHKATPKMRDAILALASEDQT